MKTKKYYLGLAVVIGILCAPVLGEVELSPPGTLLGQPNPALAGIDKLCVVITQVSAEPNKDGLDREELEVRIISKLGECGIRISTAIGGDILNIPELRVGMDMLKLEDLQQYVFHIQTSLATKVSLSGQPPFCIKADVWKAEPAMQAVSVQSMPSAVTSAVLEQVEAFIHAYLAANPPNKRPTDANDISEAAKEQLKPAAESAPAEYKYVASKISNIFHKPDCHWVKQIKPENLVYYSSREEAINTGKKPCRQCNP